MFTSAGKWLVVVMILLLIISSTVAYIYIRKYQAANETNSNNSAIIKTATKLVKTEIDTFNITHTKVETQSPITTSQQSKQELPGWADTAARGLDLGAQYKTQLEAQTRITITLRDSLLQAKHLLNAAKQDIFFYKNKFIELQYTAGNPGDTSDRGKFAYRYTLSPVVTQYNTRNWFLGPRHFYLDIASPDTNAHFNNVQHYQVEQPEPVFSVHLAAGGKYNFATKLLSPGTRLRFDIGRVSLFGSVFYNYDQPTTPWVISAGAFYDFIKF